MYQSRIQPTVIDNTYGCIEYTTYSYVYGVRSDAIPLCRDQERFRTAPEFVAGHTMIWVVYEIGQE